MDFYASMSDSRFSVLIRTCIVPMPIPSLRERLYNVAISRTALPQVLKLPPSPGAARCGSTGCRFRFAGARAAGHGETCGIAPDWNRAAPASPPKRRPCGAGPV